MSTDPLRFMPWLNIYISKLFAQAFYKKKDGACSVCQLAVTTFLASSGDVILTKIKSGKSPKAGLSLSAKKATALLC